MLYDIFRFDYALIFRCLRRRRRVFFAVDVADDVYAAMPPCHARLPLRYAYVIDALPLDIRQRYA